jgi:hypothetical protein
MYGIFCIQMLMRARAGLEGKGWSSNPPVQIKYFVVILLLILLCASKSCACWICTLLYYSYNKDIDLGAGMKIYLQERVIVGLFLYLIYILDLS